jgi:hypothetical protein
MGHFGGLPENREKSGKRAAGRFDQFRRAKVNRFSFAVASLLDSDKGFGSPKSSGSPQSACNKKCQIRAKKSPYK